MQLALLEDIPTDPEIHDEHISSSCLQDVENDTMMHLPSKQEKCERLHGIHYVCHCVKVELIYRF